MVLITTARTGTLAQGMAGTALTRGSTFPMFLTVIQRRKGPEW